MSMVTPGHAWNTLIRRRGGFLHRLALICLLTSVLVPALPVPAASAATLATPPTSPILVVADAASPNPYGPYLPEILHAEGLNSFQVDQLANQTATSLASYPIVLLAQTTLSASQATLFTNYVNGGGTLIAMRPDPQLAPIFGIVAAGGTTSEGYILTSQNSSVSSGITHQTLRFHGSADN
jgi:hypothetical protein